MKVAFFLILALYCTQVMSQDIKSLRGAQDAAEKEEEAHYVHHVKVPPVPEGSSKVSINSMNKDKVLTATYADALPSFLLTATNAHHKYYKSTTRQEDKEKPKAKGFLPQGHYLIDLAYIFKKETEIGHIYTFGFWARQCEESKCKNHVELCGYVGSFTAYVPLNGHHGAFLDYSIELPQPGFMQCPNFFA